MARSAARSGAAVRKVRTTRAPRGRAASSRRSRPDVTFVRQMTQERKAGAGVTAVLLERPLAPRSLIASLLLGMRPPRMPAGRLVEWCGLFGVAEGTARVALSRMLDRGELTATDGVYELAGR